jgi:hypothetical protein
MAARVSCPTPVYNQAVYKYHRSAGTLEFLWSIPDEARYNWLVKNILNLTPEEQVEGKFCYLMSTGELLKWVIKENGNKPDGLIKDAKNKPYIVTKDTKEPQCQILQL